MTAEASRAAAHAHPAADRALLGDVRARLEAAADPVRAPAMQAYMKSALLFHGVPSTPMRAIARAAIEAHPLPSFEAWRDTILALWYEATHREERYVALEVAAARPYGAYRTRNALPLFEELVVTGAWWDLVDATTRLVGVLVRDDHDWAAARMREWSTDPVLWKRRVAIISQLGRREATDWPLLRDCIEPNLDDRAFFIRKAIGWALREYAKSEPERVARYLEECGPRLSPLSRREATKHLAHLAHLAGLGPEVPTMATAPEPDGAH